MKNLPLDGTKRKETKRKTHMKFGRIVYKMYENTRFTPYLHTILTLSYHPNYTVFTQNAQRSDTKRSSMRIASVISVIFILYYFPSKPQQTKKYTVQAYTLRARDTFSFHFHFNIGREITLKK